MEKQLHEEIEFLRELRGDAFTEKLLRKARGDPADPKPIGQQLTILRAATSRAIARDADENSRKEIDVQFSDDSHYQDEDEAIQVRRIPSSSAHVEPAEPDNEACGFPKEQSGQAFAIPVNLSEAFAKITDFMDDQHNAITMQMGFVIIKAALKGKWSEGASSMAETARRHGFEQSNLVKKAKAFEAATGMRLPRSATKSARRAYRAGHAKAQAAITSFPHVYDDVHDISENGPAS